MNFSELIAPISRSDFFENYYEKKPLLIKRNNPDFYKSIFTLQDFDEYFQRSDLKFPAVQMAEGGDYIYPQQFANSDNEIDFQKLIFNFNNNGRTIVLNDVQDSIRKFTEFTNGLEMELGLPINNNVYFSPKNSQGFGKHSDKFDGIVLQFHGTKSWEIYNHVEELSSQKFHYKKESLVQATLELQMAFDLEEGDFLYIPRGVYHRAFTKDHISGHVNVGFTTFYGYNSLNNLGSRLYQNVFFRKAYPVEVERREDYFNTYRKELISLLESMTAKEFEELMIGRIKTQQKSLVNNMISKFLINKYSDDMEMTKSYRGEYQIFDERLFCVLTTFNLRLELPSNYRNALESCMNLNSLKIGDIQLDKEINRIQLAKRLIKEGLFELK